MFVRTVKARGSRGVKHEYLRLVESYWENGRSRQRVVLNLGRKDILAPHVDSLVRILEGEKKGDKWVRFGEVNPDDGACWGPALAAATLWRELGLDVILDSCQGGKRRRQSTPLADRALVLATHRLLGPGSEHSLAERLETDYLCDRRGRRWLPPWEEHGRVKVNRSWLQRWYRTLDELLRHKEEIEEGLYLRLRDLFSLQAEMVLYDITSVYFEGHGPQGLAYHGYSRDDKPRQRQVLVGVVMVNGWPIAHYVFPGNEPDAVTVKGVVKDLERRFGLKRVVFVGDRGMVTTDNIRWLREHGHGYLVGLQRRRREEVYRLIERARGPWVECPTRVGNGEENKAYRTWVQEVEGEGSGVRVLVVHSEERLAYEREMREAAMKPTRVALERLAKRVARGRLKAPEKIGAAAARILSRHHGKRYFGWKLEGGVFHYFEHPNLEREKAYEGKYLIQTEEKGLTPVEAVRAYKELSEVEQAFRQLKDVIGMRPIYHREGQRVRGHIFVAALAFLLQRALEKKLKAAAVGLSAETALEALRTVLVVDITAGTERKLGVTGGRKRARQVLAALGITHLHPPAVTEKQPKTAT
jgi:transposase